MVELERHQAAPAAYYVKTENKMYSRMWIVNRIRPAHSQQTDPHVAELFQKHKKTASRIRQPNRSGQAWNWWNPAASCTTGLTHTFHSMINKVNAKLKLNEWGRHDWEKLKVLPRGYLPSSPFQRKLVMCQHFRQHLAVVPGSALHIIRETSSNIGDQ